MNINRLRDKLARNAVKYYKRNNAGNKKLETSPTPDGPWTQVYGDDSEEGVTSADEILADNDLRTRTFFIPRQFAADNVTVIFPPYKADGAEDLFTGYQIRFIGQKAQYSVQTYKSVGNGAVFELSAINYKTNMYGLTK